MWLREPKSLIKCCLKRTRDRPTTISSRLCILFLLLPIRRIIPYLWLLIPILDSIDSQQKNQNLELAAKYQFWFLSEETTFLLGIVGSNCCGWDLCKKKQLWLLCNCDNDLFPQILSGTVVNFMKLLSYRLKIFVSKVGCFFSCSLIIK